MIEDKDEKSDDSSQDTKFLQTSVTFLHSTRRHTLDDNNFTQSLPWELKTQNDVRSLRLPKLYFVVYTYIYMPFTWQFMILTN